MACHRAPLSSPAAAAPYRLASRHRLPFRDPINRPSPLPPGTLTLAISSRLRPLLPLRPLRCSHPPLDASADPSRSIASHGDAALQEWDATTAWFAGASNVPFLILQLPQILLNARNLLAGNKSALFAVPWLGMLTGLIGNLSLLSYFAKKRETGAVLVQTLGVLSTYAVIAQLALAEAMPLPHFIATSVVVGCGLLLNFLNYFGWLSKGLWRLWEDFITVGGLSVLPQVMWSTFVPFIPNSILPGTVSCVVALAAVIMARTKKLSEKGIKFVLSLSGWTATLLFMWMPVAQMWTNYLNPDNIRGLSSITMLLAMVGNGLLIPRALFIRDLMWFVGASWSSCLYGWGNLVCMYCFGSIGKEFFWGATSILSIWLGFALWRDTMAYGHYSPLRTLKELASGER